LKRYLAGLFACASFALSGCSVEETHQRCAGYNDCPFGQECYLGYCVIEAALDAASSSKRDAATSDDAPLRRRPTPTLTGRSEGDASQRVNSATAEPCVESDEDAGIGQGACCESAVSCYEGPKDTRDVGRCKSGMRECKDGKLGACEGSVQPRDEACDNQGADDNCDGMNDNVPGRGDACMIEGVPAACRQGKRECMDGEKDLQCVAAQPPAEMCNNRDDDCDTRVDEGFDVNKDTMNCGRCGMRCADMQVCCDGACSARGTGPEGCPECSATKPCAAGRNCCDGACADTENDVNHCGACGNACAARQTCCGGRCVDTRSDEMNCGSCGNACTQAPSTTCCASSCVDITSDRRHCGACGNGCGTVCQCEVDNGMPMCRGPLGICF
jgi:hypothetical protein